MEPGSEIQGVTGVVYGHPAEGRLPRRGDGMALRVLERQLTEALPMVEAELGKCVQYAVRVRDDPESNERTKMRAVEYLERVREKGIDVAMYLDKIERPVQHTSLTQVNVDQRTIVCAPPRVIGE